MGTFLATPTVFACVVLSGAPGASLVLLADPPPGVSRQEVKLYKNAR